MSAGTAGTTGTTGSTRSAHRTRPGAATPIATTLARTALIGTALAGTALLGAALTGAPVLTAVAYGSAGRSYPTPANPGPANAIPANPASADPAAQELTRPPALTALTAPTSERLGGLLDVAYDDGAGHTRTYRLTCGAATDSGPATSAACAHLDTIGGPVPAVPPGQACSMIYGGPQTARVTGNWQGRAVRESYRRTNGCEVARWNRMVPALPNPVADASHRGAAPVHS
jgi:hypothetical protein